MMQRDWRLIRDGRSYIDERRLADANAGIGVGRTRQCEVAKGGISGVD